MGDYINFWKLGLFGWTSWDLFIDYCEAASSNCSSLYNLDSYNGWSVGLYFYMEDWDMSGFTDVNDAVGFCFDNMDYWCTAFSIDTD